MSIGQSLAAARADAGLTVAAVSDATRIRQTIITAMEHDDFSRCGGDFYARGHIRNIAQVVGTDPAPLLEEFDAARGIEAPRASEVFESETHARPERRGPNWSAAMAAALVVVLVYGAFQIFNSSGEPRRQAPLAGETTSSAPATAKPSASVPRSTPRPPGPVAQAPRNAVTVQLAAANGKSWVGVFNGAGDQVFQGLMNKGQVKTFSDKKLLKFTIGNAGAVTLVVNGKNVGSPGGRGEVAHVQFTPTDPAAA